MMPAEDARRMKTVTVDTRLPPPTHDVGAHQLAAYLAGYLCDKSSGALYGQWDEATRRGTWFYSTDAAAIFSAPSVDEVLFEEDQRWRFRSVVFRLGSMASETPGDLCGVMRLVPRDGRQVDSGPRRAYVVHASFYPDAGLWFKAAIVSAFTEDDARSGL
jgi:hypothetical protein